MTTRKEVGSLQIKLDPTSYDTSAIVWEPISSDYQVSPYFMLLSKQAQRSLMFRHYFFCELVLLLYSQDKILGSYGRTHRLSFVLIVAAGIPQPCGA